MKNILVGLNAVVLLGVGCAQTPVAVNISTSNEVPSAFEGRVAPIVEVPDSGTRSPDPKPEETNEDGYTLILPTKTLPSRAREFVFDASGVKFSIPAIFSQFNVFKSTSADSNTYSAYQLFAFIDVATVNEANKWVGDALPADLSIHANLGNKSLAEFVTEFLGVERILENSDVVINNIKYKKIIYSSFGSSRVVNYLTMIDSRIYWWQTIVESDKEKLIKQIIDSAVFYPPMLYFN